MLWLDKTVAMFKKIQIQKCKGGASVTAIILQSRVLLAKTTECVSNTRYCICTAMELQLTPCSKGESHLRPCLDQMLQE